MESKLCILLTVFLIFGKVSSQGSNSLDFDDVQKKLKDNGGPDLSDIEKKLQDSGVNIPDLNNTKLDAEKFENVLRDKCEKQGAGDAVEALKEQQESVQNCVSQKINGSQLQEELEEAKKSGSMDEVFAKYCNMWPSVYGCVENVTTTLRSCLTEKEQKAFNQSLNIVQDLQQFMCVKDGDRLAMFVAEGGVECVQEQQEGIKNCLNSTVGGRLPDPSELSVATLPTFLFSEEDCHDFDKIRLCVNVELERCKDTTPANIVDAFFKFLKKQMPCGKDGGYVALKAAAATSEKGGNSGYSIVNSALVTLIMLVLIKMY